MESSLPVIDSFSGHADFLSNFFPSVLEYEGEEYATVEHAFQAAKTAQGSRAPFRAPGLTPGQAKRLGRSVSLRPDWDSVRIPVMRTCLLAKFTRHPDLRARLVNTGAATLIEGNTWGDRFWGVCGGIGQNHLGILLMEMRAFFR